MMVVARASYSGDKVGLRVAGSLDIIEAWHTPPKSRQRERQRSPAMPPLTGIRVEVIGKLPRAFAADPRIGDLLP
jgi:hypothetical protein